LIQPAGSVISLTAKRIEVNRAASAVVRTLLNERTVLDAQYIRPLRLGKFHVGLGYDDSPSELVESAGARAFLSWSGAF
jgi:hypothetical protein